MGLFFITIKRIIMETNKEQPGNTNPGQTPQKGHTDTDRAREDDDRSIHKTKEDIRQVPHEPDDEPIEHTSWERPQTEEDKDRVL